MPPIVNGFRGIALALPLKCIAAASLRCHRYSDHYYRPTRASPETASAIWCVLRHIGRLIWRVQGRTVAALLGAIAQLGERLHGMQEVGGSIPPGSTTDLPRINHGSRGINEVAVW